MTGAAINTGAASGGPGASPVRTGALFQVQDVSLRFGGVQAISHVSFSVNQGEVFAIIGPNGAGKTSMLNVITRVFDPTSGSVQFEGRDITALPRHKVVHHGIARTFQNIELFEGGTVLDNLLLGRHRFAHGNFAAQWLWTPAVRAAEAQSRAHVEDVIDLLDLMPYRNSPVAGLPYGVRKVVELARALATQPRLLLLDEPASGLNPEETRDLAFWIEHRLWGDAAVGYERQCSFLFDRGCYHCARRTNLPGLLETVEWLAAPNARLLMLCGNADESAEHGPPKVTEAEIRSRAFGAASHSTVSRNPGRFVRRAQ